jgi:hypothetical protein
MLILMGKLCWVYMISPDEVDFFNLPNPSGRTVALRLTQLVTEMSTRNLSGGKKWPTRRADNLATICEPKDWTSSKPKGLHHSLYRDNFTFTCMISASAQLLHKLNWVSVVAAPADSMPQLTWAKVPVLIFYMQTFHFIFCYIWCG